MDDLEGPLNFFNLFQTDESAANATMQTDNPILDYSCKRKTVKEIVDLVKDRILVRRVLPKPVTAFFGKPERIIDLSVLMVASQQMDLVGEADLQGHQ